MYKVCSLDLNLFLDLFAFLTYSVDYVKAVLFSYTVQRSLSVHYVITLYCRIINY